MKKILYILIIFSLAACIQESEEQRKITVSLEQTQVKAALTSDREKIVWENGDRIGIYHDGSGLQNTFVEYTGSDKMTTSVPSSAQNIYSMFPYSSTSGENCRNVNTSVPSRQSQQTPGILEGDRWPMTAAAEIKDNHASLLFNPLTALLALNIYSSEPETSEAVTRVRVIPTLNTGFCGNAGIDITSSEAAFTSGDSSDPLCCLLAE